MTTTATGPVGAHFGRDLSCFEEIHREDRSLVVFRRTLRQDRAAALGRFIEHHRPSVELEAPAAIEWVLDGLDQDARAWLRDDVCGLADRFAAVAGALDMKIRFGVVDGDQCRKFHVDYVRLRMVTTYVGPGTLWLPEYAVDREALAHPSGDPEADNRRIVRYPNAVRRADAGDVLLMKGAIYGGSHPSLVHRSPSIAETSARRLVLVLSTVD
jgi:hypothetical protein